MHINTGNGRFKLTEKAVLNMIIDNNASISGISESNAEVEKPLTMAKRKRLFKGFTIEDKVWDGYPLARFSFVISNKITYKRRKDLENTTNPLIVLEVKRSNKRKVYIVGCYRQWRGKSPQCLYNLYKMTIKSNVYRIFSTL